METIFKDLLKKWPHHAACVLSQRPTLVLSKSGLNKIELASLQEDFLHATDENTLSIVTSLKMMHVYIRQGFDLYDYRPHRGVFSGLSKSDYKVGNSDRAEILLRLNPQEMNHFKIYIKSIFESPRKTLGKCWPLQLREPDFTVRSHLTEGELFQNQLLNPQDRHNCLTWFTTAPLGAAKNSVMNLLGMSSSDIEAEAHSYIVAFYRFLIQSACDQRVPGLIFWTNDPVEQAISKIQSQNSMLLDFYDPVSKNNSQNSQSDMSTT